MLLRQQHIAALLGLVLRAEHRPPLGVRDSDLCQPRRGHSAEPIVRRSASRLSRWRNDLRQADEYYTAAEHVALPTEPLLQYYGAQALAKAAILARLVQELGRAPDAAVSGFRYDALQ